ncbi:uncharacterized protein LOC132304077 isoform X2 [Cornus florida]|nr:uncharacterized protein LOC132304077 isoform X2 [Cornus florida]
MGMGGVGKKKIENILVLGMFDRSRSIPRVNLTAYSTTDVVEFQCPPSTQVTVEISDVVDEQLYDLIAAEAFARKFVILNGKHATSRCLEKAQEKVPQKAKVSLACVVISGVLIKKVSTGPIVHFGDLNLKIDVKCAKFSAFG